MSHLPLQILGVVVTCQDTDGLQSLAEAHVVTEDAMEFVLVKEGQPVHTILREEGKHFA